MMTLSADLVITRDACKQNIERKQSDMDSGLELEDNNNRTDLNSKLLLLTAENSHLLSKMEQLNTENRRLMEEIRSNSSVMATGNLMISSLNFMLKQREASFQELSEKYETFCHLVGDYDPDSWTLGLIKNLIEKVTGDDDGSDDTSEEVHRLKYLIGFLEDSLCKMDNSLRREVEWRKEAEDEMTKLHRELKSMISLNNNLRNKVEWYEVKTVNLENQLRKRLRANELLKVRLNELQEMNEELTLQIVKKKREKTRKKRQRTSLSESLVESFSIQEPQLNTAATSNDNKESFSSDRSHNLDIVSEEKYKQIKLLLSKEESISKNFKTQLEKINEEHLLIKNHNKELVQKVKNMATLRKNFIKLALKHKQSVDTKNENLTKTNETILQLKKFLKISEVDFIQRATESKWALNMELNEKGYRQGQLLVGLINDTDEEFLSSIGHTDTIITDDFENEEVKFEHVDLEEVVMTSETILEDVETPSEYSAERQLIVSNENIDITKRSI